MEPATAGDDAPVSGGIDVAGPEMDPVASTSARSGGTRYQSTRKGNKDFVVLCFPGYYHAEDAVGLPVLFSLSLSEGARNGFKVSLPVKTAIAAPVVSTPLRCEPGQVPIVLDSWRPRSVLFD